MVNEPKLQPMGYNDGAWIGTRRQTKDLLRTIINRSKYVDRVNCWDDAMLLFIELLEKERV